MPHYYRLFVSYVLLLCGCAEDPQTLPYQGQEIRIAWGSKEFRAACQNESITLAPQEAMRVERLLLGASVPRKGLTHNEMVRFTSDLKFPGYGESDHTGRRQPDGTRFWVIQLEVPCRAKDRVITFHEENGLYYVIDDFVNPAEEGPILGVSQSDVTLSYERPGGKTAIVRTAFSRHAGGA